MDFISVIVVDKEGHNHHLSIPNEEGYSLMEMLRAAELPVLGTCGGMALCASCHVYILSDNDLGPKTSDEEIMLDSLHNTRTNSRLSCQLRISSKLNGLECQLAE